MDNLCYVKLKNHLLTLDLENQLVTIIEKKVKAIPNYLDLKLDNDLILYVCNIVENSDISKKSKIKKKKIDKKEFVITILTRIFGYLDSDKKQVDRIIEHMYIKGDIKKIPILKKCKSLMFEWVKKKLL